MTLKISPAGVKRQRIVSKYFAISIMKLGYIAKPILQEGESTVTVSLKTGIYQSELLQSLDVRRRLLKPCRLMCLMRLRHRST